MKKKMNRMFVVISLVAIILTTGLITVVYYNLFRGQVLADLKDYLVVMQKGRVAAQGPTDEVLASGAVGDAFHMDIRPHDRGRTGSAGSQTGGKRNPGNAD